MRPKADILAEVREAAATRPQGSPAARPDRQPLRGARRSGLRLRRAARGGARGRRHRAHPVRQPASAARRRRVPGRDGAACRRSAGTCTCRCSRARRACSRRCGAATRARAISTWSRSIRERAAGRALSTDMIVGFPGETEADFEDTLTLTRGRRGITACSRSSTRRGRTRWPRSGCRTMCRRTEKTRRIVALQALQREIQTELNEAHGRTDGRRAGRRRRAGGARPSCRAGRARNVVVNLPGPADVDWPDGAGPHRAGGSAQRVGPIVDAAGVLTAPARRLGCDAMQIEMTIKGLMVDPITNMPIVILRDKDGQKVLPIWVGIVRGERHRAADREHRDAAADDARPAAQRHPRSEGRRCRRSSSATCRRTRSTR